MHRCWAHSWPSPTVYPLTLTTPLYRHAQVLGTLLAFSHWLCQLNLDSLRNEAQPTLQLTLRTLVTSLVDSVTPLIVEGVPEKVVLLACQFLLSLVYTVRPRFAASLPAIQGLMEKAAQGKLTALPSKVSGCGCTGETDCTA